MRTLPKSTNKGRREAPLIYNRFFSPKNIIRIAIAGSARNFFPRINTTGFIAFKFWI